MYERRNEKPLKKPLAVEEAGLRIPVELLLSAKEVKKILRCSLPLVYRMADRGQLPCVRWECPGVGKRKKSMVRFSPEDIREFIEKHRRKRT